MARLLRGERRAHVNAGTVRAVIFTADDFGRSLAINDAVERAHREGVLTAASLMVAEPAAPDAVARARRLPGLRVGLHLTLLDGVAMLPPARIPLLVDGRGAFADDELRAAVGYFVRPGIRAQLEAEIRAQFAAFAATGLALDHVNAHHHLHVHPTIFGLVLRVGRDYGRPPVRIPHEPGAPWWLVPWLALMSARARAAGVRTNRRIFGLRESGGMNAAALLRILHELPPGLNEVYLHPGAAEGELAALVDPAVIAAIRGGSLRVGGFADLA